MKLIYQFSQRHRRGASVTLSRLLTRIQSLCISLARGEKTAEAHFPLSLSRGGMLPRISDIFSFRRAVRAEERGRYRVAGFIGRENKIGQTSNYINVVFRIFAPTSNIVEIYTKKKISEGSSVVYKVYFREW